VLLYKYKIYKIGHESKIYGHLLKIHAEKYLDITHGECVITGKINSVENTKFDFRDFVLIGDRTSSDTKPEDSLSVYFVVNDENAVDKKSDYKRVAMQFFLIIKHYIYFLFFLLKFSIIKECETPRTA
jgi:hypothetical protein